MLGLDSRVLIMQTVTCFEVYGHADTTEGRAPMKVVARFSTRDVAEHYVKSPQYRKWCVMGYQNPREDVKNIRETQMVIFDSVEELTEQNNQAAKARALAKLTLAERKLLGLS
jgi:hypothetical protein